MTSCPVDFKSGYANTVCTCCAVTVHCPVVIDSCRCAVFCVLPAYLAYLISVRIAVEEGGGGLDISTTHPYHPAFGLLLGFPSWSYWAHMPQHVIPRRPSVCFGRGGWVDESVSELPSVAFPVRAHTQYHL
ncbi:hypothetical protein B0T25DRAFT_325114 [Lasiosphaeria hispida]|uniref:Uncharacterized protein n=1 Tax=Lasiosphaeria hispida TaxID=260671 RepID=A0AAJ0H9P4_9PEZI|nr:hypothetical protein B0T25DRAFT_325114 [Lasiosphaeria hispida]